MHTILTPSWIAFDTDPSESTIHAQPQPSHKHGKTKAAVMARLFSSAAVLLAAALTGLVAAVPYTPRLRTAQFTGRHMQEMCVPSLEWTSEGGELLVNGQPFHLKGKSVLDPGSCSGGYR